MKLSTRSFVSVLLAILLMGAPDPARACCDDFWSCAAAVLSGGISCAIESLLKTIAILRIDVSALRDRIAQDLSDVRIAALKDVRDRSDESSKGSEDAKTGLAGALRDAQQALAAAEVQWAPNRTAPTPTPGGGSGLSAVDRPGGLRSTCDSPSIVASLRQAVAVVKGEEAAAAADAAAARNRANEAQAKTDAVAFAAEQKAKDRLLGPLFDLDALLDDLARHPDHFFDPSAALAAVLAASSAAGPEMQALADAVARAAGPSLSDQKASMQRMKWRWAAAAALAEAMKKLVALPVPANCNALVSLLPPSGTSLVAHLTQVSPGFRAVGQANAVAELPGAAPGKVRALASAYTRPAAARWDEAKRLHLAVQHPVPISGADANLARHADALFAGLTRAQADSKTQDLLAEARRRFAGDPALLQKVVDYIRREAVRRR